MRLVVEGFIDLLYEESDGQLVVLDYKTDSVSGAALDTRLDDYRLQGGVYALLTSEVLGRQVSRIEFVFAAAGETRVISDVAAVTNDARTRINALLPAVA